MNRSPPRRKVCIHLSPIPSDQIPHRCIPADTGPSATDVYFEEIVPKRGPFKIYVTNLPFKITEQDVIDYFDGEHSVKVSQVHFVMKEDGKMSGRGFLHMPTRESMIKVLKMDAFSFKNRSCKVAIAESRGGKGGRQQGGRQDRSSQRGGYGGRSGDRPRQGDRRQGRAGERSGERGGKQGSGAFGAFGSKRKEESDVNIEDVPPPAGPKRVNAGTVDPAVLDKYSMKSGVMTVGEDGRPRLNLAPRTAPLPEIAVTPMEGGAPTRSSRPNRNRTQNRGGGRKADGWQDATHHTGGRRNQKRGGGVVSAAVAAAEAGIDKQEGPVATGSNTIFDALYSDSDSE